MVKVLILEDNVHMMEILKEIVSEDPLVEEVIDTHSGKEAIKLAKDNKPDIALLDISLNNEKGLDGIEVAKKINNFNPETYLLFITGHTEYAIDAFEVHPYDYILKPFSEDRVKKVVNTLARKIVKGDSIDKRQDRQDNIVIKTSDELLLVLYLIRSF